MNIKSIYLLLLINCSIITSCAKNPVTGQSELRLVSENQERQIGDEAYKKAQQAQGGAYILDPKLTSYVASVGNRIAKESARPTLSFEFVILNDSTPNAWALPGGKIAINRGLLTELQSEAELAAVLGHEIVHAAARHGAKGIERGMLLQGGILALGVASQNSRYNDILIDSASIGASLVMSKYSRHQELESDRFGMMYMAKAGYNPEAAIRLQELFLKLSEGKNDWGGGLFASHPPSQERIDANKKTLLEITEGREFFEGRDEYKQAISSLLTQKESYSIYDEGNKALKKKRYDLARQFADKAIAIHKDEALFYHLKGKAYLAEKKPEEALEHFSKAIELNPDFFEFYLKRAECRKLLGDLKGSQSDAKMSAGLLPTGEAHELLGRLALQAKDKKRAIYHFQIASNAQSPAGARARSFMKQIGG